jgi:hypothetical protein
MDPATANAIIIPELRPPSVVLFDPVALELELVLDPFVDDVGLGFTEPLLLLLLLLPLLEEDGDGIEFALDEDCVGFATPPPPPPPLVLDGGTLEGLTGVGLLAATAVGEGAIGLGEGGKGLGEGDGGGMMGEGEGDEAEEGVGEGMTDGDGSLMVGLRFFLLLLLSKSQFLSRWGGGGCDTCAAFTN